MPRTFGLLGAGAQADEIEEFARPDRALFRAVDAPYVDAAAGTIDVLVPNPAQRELSVVAAVGAPGLRRSLVEAWPGHSYHRVISSQSWIAEDAMLGEGVMVAPMAAISIRTRVGDHALINMGATLSHDSRVGDYATLSPGAHVAGHCRIGDGAFLGIGASVTQGVRVASGVVIGAGAVVVRDIDEPGVYVGVPARRLRALEEWLHEL